MNLANGQQIGRYEIRSLLGVGGMGEVFLAEDTELNRNVALKILPEEIEADISRMGRFVIEAKTASALNHPNIITIYEIGDFDEHQFIAAEYIEGETLFDLLKHGPLLPKQAIQIMRQIVTGLAAAHRAGVVHCDVAPRNIMIRPDGIVKILDFGVAELMTRPKAPGPKPVSPRPDQVEGTVAYMSPEQVCGATVDARTDIWSCGVVLYEMLTGRQPFTGTTPGQIIGSILYREPAPLQELVPDLLLVIENIVGTAMQKKPVHRYQSADEMLLDLKEAAREIEMRDTDAPDRFARTQKFDVVKHTFGTAWFDQYIRRHKYAAAAWLLVAVAGIAALGLWYVREGPAATTQIDSIAVLPFRNDSGDPELDYISDGLSENLIDKLTRMSHLKVIARSSSFKIRGVEDPARAAQALGARSIVTGRVSRSGDRLTVRVELVDALDNRQIWSEQYERTREEIQNLQDEIFAGIAESLRPPDGTAARPETAPARKASPEAYELLLKARFALRQYTPESARRAVDLYSRAIAIAPEYPRAYAELAYAYRVLGASAFADPREMNSKAQAAASRALELNDNLPLAHLVLAEIARDNWDWAPAEREYRRSLELNPGLAESREGYALYLSVLARHDEAITEMHQAREVDPFNILTNISLGAVYYNARRYDEAIAVLNRTLELDPNAPITHTWLGIAISGSGAPAEALAEFEQAIRLGDDTTSTQCYYGYSLAKTGRHGEAERILKNLERSEKFVSPTSIALLYVGLGRADQALNALERALEARDPQLQYLNVETHFDPLRKEARFQRIVQSVGLGSA